MEINYQLSEEDFVEAYSAHRKRSLVTKWTVRVFLAFAVLLGVVVFAGAINDPKLRTVSNLLPVSLLLVFWFIALRILPRFNMKRQFRNQPGAQGPRMVTFSTEGTHWRWNGGSADVAWKNYIRWIEGKNQILLYTSPACFNILPVRTLDSNQLTELRDLLKQNIRT